ncbi:MAG: TIM barrel protein [Bacteroidota bacterium]
MNRRNFLKVSSASVAGLGLAPGLVMSGMKPKPYPICVFSKCLQFLAYDELGEVVAKLGFDGVDLTVRKGGHVLPENVKKDLPNAVKAIRRAGIVVPMISTDINDPDDRFTEQFLGFVSDSGIQYYRMGYYSYSPKLTVFENLDNNRRKLEKLEKINRKYTVRGGYQNHSGPWGMIGGAVWDLYHMLKDIDPEYTGVQYDIAHAMVEGGFSWSIALEVIAPWVNSLAIKDYVWEKGEKRWNMSCVPLGEGMVDFKKYLENIDSKLSSVPITMHYEYNLGGSELGHTNPLMPPECIYKNLARDLHYFKNSLLGS